jgi:malate/lactate dehydrogenase
MISKTSKVGIIGAGNVGADVANALVLLGRCVRVVLFDRTLSLEFRLTASARNITPVELLVKNCCSAVGEKSLKRKSGQRC